MSILPDSNSHPERKFINFNVISQEVWNQLENCLDDLPAPQARMIVLIMSMGLKRLSR